MKRAFFLIMGALAFPIFSQEPPTLKLTQTIPLPGVKGRFDHFAVDVKGRRLFVAALGNNTLEVIDLAAGKRIKSLAAMSKPTGVLYLAEWNQVLVANGNGGTLEILDGASFTDLITLASLDGADNLRFDPATKLVYLGYGDGALGVIDTTSARQVAAVKLPKHPESFQLEKQGARIFVNIPGAKQVAVVNREKRAVIQTWPVGKFAANFPMALDEADRRLFLGCRKPARLLVLDTASGKSVTDLAISGDIDDLFYDAAHRRLYASCGEGFVDVIGQLDASRYQRRERIATRPGARTSLFVAQLGLFCLAVPQRENQPAEIRVFQVVP